MDKLIYSETLMARRAYERSKHLHTMTLNSPKNPGQSFDADSKPRILYLDDDQGNLDSFKANFRDQFEIFTSVNPVQAYNLIEPERIQIAIADHNMPSMSGVEFLGSLSQDFPNVQRILLTGYTEMIPVLEAINKGRVFGVLTKPFNMKEIAQMVREAWDSCRDLFEKEKTIHQLIRQNQQFEFILRQRLLS
jgi:response regulator RpfG family c-di-GMP phosphodiesterase